MNEENNNVSNSNNEVLNQNTPVENKSTNETLTSESTSQVQTTPQPQVEPVNNNVEVEPTVENTNPTTTPQPTVSNVAPTTSAGQNPNDFSNVIDPSKITVPPSTANPQIPVNNPASGDNKNNKTVDKPEEKKNNTFSLILVFLLFVGVGAFIWFMPEIRSYLNKEKKTTTENNTSSEEKTSTDASENYTSMICSNVSKNYTFYYQDDALKKYSVSVTYTSDIDANYNSCLTARASEVTGFVVECQKDTNSLIMNTSYDFTKLPDSFTGKDMEYKKDDSIKTIKSKLQSNGYTCS